MTLPAQPSLLFGGGRVVYMCGCCRTVRFGVVQPVLCMSCVLPAANLGVFVTREHVRHNKSGITHRGKTRISH
jgi:hypothetical protein